MKKCIACISVLLIFALSLLSCSSDVSGKKTFVNTLFGDYSAEAEYLLECDGVSLAGEIRVTKDDNIRLEILSPDPFSGICVQSDSAGEMSALSISYSGIAAEVSGEMLDKLNLLLTLFCDSTVGAFEHLSAKSFVPCEDTYTVQGLSETTAYMAECSVGDISYLYIYDSVTGTPLRFIAQSGGSAVEIKMKKFKIADVQ